MKKLLYRLWRRLKQEPAMVAAALSAALAWLAERGFELSDTEEALVWTIAALIFGAAVRQAVTPNSKLP